MSKKRQVKEDRLNAFFKTLALDLDAASDHRRAHTAFAIDRLKTRMRKRAEIEAPSLHTKACDDFVSLNAYVGEHKYEIDPDVRAEARDFILFALERAVKRYDPDSVQECFSSNWILENWRYGPGASNGVKGYGTVQKIDKPMTATASCEPLVRLIRSEHPYFRAYDGLEDLGGTRLVGGSKLTTVLKNETAVRTIAIEPSGNMAIQLAGGMLIEEALRGVGLDIRTQQPKNKYLAKIGSLHGKLCTIDLKSASDMQSMTLVQDLWPSIWVEFFEKTRSKTTVLPDGRAVQLNMVSTMGNGFTFPLMTMTICALIYALRRVKGGPRRFVHWQETCVFGDDIIVPTHEYQDLCNALSGCGYVVNHDKSYIDGPFRESCGGDYFEGYDVTPFYAKSLSHYADVYVVLNQVLSWSARHEVPLVRSLTYLKGLLGSKCHLVPEWMADTSGVRCTLGPARYTYLAEETVTVRYTGRYEYSLISGGYGVSGKDGCVMYQPRKEWVRYKVRKARLPNGYLDGWDPLTRSRRESSYVEILLNVAGFLPVKA